MLSPSTLQAALAFRRERAWEEFHTPQNLAIAISVEAGELLEQFQWRRPDEASPTDVRRAAIEEEVADIVILLSYLVNDLGMELDEIVRRKLALNAARYPIEQSRGNAMKYTEFHLPEQATKPGEVG